jgi:hypothetical protein
VVNSLIFSIDHTGPQRKTFLPFLIRLESLFSAMDEQYATTAARYGFVCKGCRDNCCRTLFFHYSLLEYLYLREGFLTLDKERRMEIRARAGNVCRQIAEDEEKGETPRRMCPLNFDGLCLLYHYRPMICRLHGLPHELTKPGQPTAYGPGCDDFDGQCKEKAYIRFDRTPFYIDMARCEKEFRDAVGDTQRIKMTVAEMLLDFSTDD